MQEMWVWLLGWEDPLEKEMATHSSILAFRITWTESLVGYSPWSHNVGHDSVTNASLLISIKEAFLDFDKNGINLLINLWRTDIFVESYMSILWLAFLYSFDFLSVFCNYQHTSHINISLILQLSISFIWVVVLSHFSRVWLCATP